MFDGIKRYMARKAIETLRSWHPSSHDPALIALFGGRTTDSGEVVTPDLALQTAAVFSCVDQKSRLISQMPLQLLRTEERARKTYTNKATDHPLYWILRKQWNPLMSSIQARKTMMAYLLLRGNAVAYIESNMRGHVKYLWPWPLELVRFEHKGFTIRYFFQTTEGEREIRKENVLHLRGQVIKDRMGLSPIEACRETVGEGIAQQRYSARFYRNGARPSGLIERESDFKDEDAKKNFIDAWKKWTTGENQHSTPILEKGMKYTPISISQQDAQFLENRKFNASQIASIFNWPVYLLNILDNANYSNVSQFSNDLVKYHLSWDLENWEQELELALLSPKEEETLKIRHNVDGLLRGDIKTRRESMRSLYMMGSLSPNEARELENLNPIEDGDYYIRQSALMRTDRPDPVQPTKQPKTTGDANNA